MSKQCSDCTSFMHKRCTLCTLAAQLAHILGNCVHFPAVLKHAHTKFPQDGNSLTTPVNKAVYSLCTQRFLAVYATETHWTGHFPSCAIWQKHACNKVIYFSFYLLWTIVQTLNKSIHQDILWQRNWDHQPSIPYNNIN